MERIPDTKPRALELRTSALYLEFSSFKILLLNPFHDCEEKKIGACQKTDIWKLLDVLALDNLSRDVYSQ